MGAFDFLKKKVFAEIEQFVKEIHIGEIEY
jgi:hypothetical protein